jgi:hypothetical protein
MATCDLCDRPLEDGAPVYKASQVRDAVHGGLRPDDDPSLDVASWLDYVEHDNTDWTLCPTCAARVDQLSAPATTGLTDRWRTLLRHLRQCRRSRRQPWLSPGRWAKYGF